MNNKDHLVYQEVQDQISGATNISDVVFGSIFIERIDVISTKHWEQLIKAPCICQH